MRSAGQLLQRDVLGDKHRFDELRQRHVCLL
jgi:hypothetical protein